MYITAVETFALLGMNIHPMVLKKVMKVRWMDAEKHSNVYCMGGNE